MKNYIFFHCTLEQYFLLRRAVQINHVNKSDLRSRLEDTMMYVYAYTPVYVHIENPQKDAGQEVMQIKLYFCQQDLLKYFPHYLLLSWLEDCEDETRNEF